MMKQTMHILDLNTGNVGSVAKAFMDIGAEAKIARTKEEIEIATHLVLPGIGHFETAMTRFHEMGITDSILTHINQNKPFLGICLGMQLLSQSSEEGNCNGLQIFNATVNQLQVSDSIQFKIPHNGWNTLDIIKNCSLLNGITVEDEFFFLHKFAWNSADQSEVYGLTTYENTFPSVIGKGNCWGVQFHPEKSHESGRKLLSNFLKLEYV